MKAAKLQQRIVELENKVAEHESYTNETVEDLNLLTNPF